MKEMRTKILMVAAVALMAMVSCTKEENNPGEPQVTPPSYYIDFTANIPSEDTSKPQLAQDTKTGYDSESGKTKWLEGDEIAVNGKKFAVVELIDGGLSARFENREELGEFGVEFKEPYTAVYPYNKTQNTTVVPHEQTLTAGTFADEAIAAVAYSESERTLSFKHVSTYLRFTVATTGLTELEFTSAGDIAGTITVNANEGGDPTYEVSEGKNTIKAIPASDTFEVGQSYYISVLPTLGSADVKQKLEIKSEGVTVKSGNVRFKRNVPAKLENLTVNYTYLKPSLVWGIASPRYAAYFFEGDANIWVNMTDTDNDGVYRAVVPEGDYTTLIYCRMDPKKNDNNWENKWSQTVDLKIPTDTKSAYIVKPLTWDKGDGTWDTLANAKDYEENTVYLKPSTNWKTDSPRFSIYLCNGTAQAQWKDMIYLDGNYYGVELPNGFNKTLYKNIIFCRMKPGTDHSWNNPPLWGQTNDLQTSQITDSKYRCCKITSTAWNKPTVSWSKKLD